MDLNGSATERLGQLGNLEPGTVEGEWLHRQLLAALEGWQATEDELNILREGREDY